MFMFRRRRRSQLTRKLLKARPKPCDEPGQELAHELLERLEYNQLQMLLKAVERTGAGGGAESGNCVLVSRKLQATTEPHVLCCRGWRWPELPRGAQLRSLPLCCPADCDPVYICCNPYHWSRLCHPETPPPPYSRSCEDMLKPEDRAPSEVPIVCRDSYGGESFTTMGDGPLVGSRAWCRLAYWEQKTRVGPTCPVEYSAVNVFGEEPKYGQGICLGNLALHSFSPPETIKRIKCKIGLGITLSLEEGGCVWLYNRSTVPVFVSSSSLEDPGHNPTRVPPEHCLCVYDPLIVNQLPDLEMGPIDKRSVKLSFEKGWGSNYHRRDITACPCWLEILIDR